MRCPRYNFEHYFNFFFSEQGKLKVQLLLYIPFEIYTHIPVYPNTRETKLRDKLIRREFSRVYISKKLSIPSTVVINLYDAVAFFDAIRRETRGSRAGGVRLPKIASNSNEPKNRSSKHFTFSFSAYCSSKPQQHRPKESYKSF